MLKSKIFLVIPAFNEEKHIKKVLSEVMQCKLPVVLIDDGSKDNTFNIGSKLADFSIRHEINLGKGAALKTGCEFAFKNGAQAIIIMDSDGQHSTNDIPKFVDALVSGCDIVYGSRDYGYGIPLIRYLGNKFASLLISYLYGIYINDLLCGFRAFTKSAYKKIQWESAGYGVETEIVIKTAVYKIKYCQVPVETIYLDRTKGVTILDSIGILFDVLRWKIKI